MRLIPGIDIFDILHGDPIDGGMKWKTPTPKLVSQDLSALRLRIVVLVHTCSKLLKFSNNGLTMRRWHQKVYYSRPIVSVLYDDIMKTAL